MQYVIKKKTNKGNLIRKSVLEEHEKNQKELDKKFK